MVGIEVKVCLGGFVGVCSSRELATGVAAGCSCSLGVSTTCTQSKQKGIGFQGGGTEKLLTALRTGLLAEGVLETECSRRAWGGGGGFLLDLLIP